MLNDPVAQGLHLLDLESLVLEMIALFGIVFMIFVYRTIAEDIVNVFYYIFFLLKFRNAGSAKSVANVIVDNGNDQESEDESFVVEETQPVIAKVS